MSKTKILITGTCGFIFSNFIRKYIDNPKYEFVSIDKLIAPYNYANILEGHKLYIGDIADEHFVDMVFKKEQPEIVLHTGAESFVDDSIKKARPFIHSNVLGTQTIVDMSVKHGVKKLIYTSTDEVLGQLKSVKEKPWTEESPINPRNPYSASKAAGELIIRAASETHGLNYIITRCCNNYGPRQPPRNLVPRVITSVLNNERIPIHGNGKQMREWIHALDHSSAIMFLIENSPLNETYNIGSGIEFTNLEMVKNICDILGQGEDLLSFVKDRPGHDFRYSVDCSKIKKLGWKPEHEFYSALKETVQWYVDNTNYFK